MQSHKISLQSAQDYDLINAFKYYRLRERTNVPTTMLATAAVMLMSAPVVPALIPSGIAVSGFTMAAMALAPLALILAGVAVYEYMQHRNGQRSAISEYNFKEGTTIADIKQALRDRGYRVSRWSEVPSRRIDTCN